MKFKFRFEAIIRQRKSEQDIAQRAYAEAADKLRKHMQFIKFLYSELDEAGQFLVNMQLSGGACAPQLLQIDDFIIGQKIKIQKAREGARELMRIEEEAHELLIAKMQALKIMERLKEIRKVEYKKLKTKKANKELDDLNTLRHQFKRSI